MSALADRSNAESRLVVRNSQLVADAFFRRQLVLAAVTAGVMLAALALVGWAMAASGGGNTVFRVTQDGSGGGAVRPVTESSGPAIWALVAALVAVGGVLVLLVAHVVRIARFAFRYQRGES